MKFISSFMGLMAVLSVVGGANAATRDGSSTANVARPSVAMGTNAARRLPTMISATTLAAISSTSTTSTTTTTDDDSSLMDMTECVDKYTECIKDPDVCGFDFEECTTSELFYAKKPQCNSVLLQCSAAGINTLFGTSDTTELSAKNSSDEYMYPTAGSVLGQFIEAGAINNRLDTSSCVKRYTSCLKKESVCGEDFELCTSNSEFKKQKIYCESTLARCVDAGKTELFGSTNTSSNPTSASRLGVMIKEGADLASVNAVSTCYKVTDQCILNACGANPYRCLVDSTTTIVNATDVVNDDPAAKKEDSASTVDVITTALVSRYIRSACSDTIGGNKYCFMTANEGKVPTASQLIDEDERDNVYSNIYSSRMNTTLREKIQKMADTFDKKAKDKCSDTITACAMRSCGSGLGSACYSRVFGNKANCFDGSSMVAGSSCSINGTSTYSEIKIGCESIVNTDANCKYAAASMGTTGYTYQYADSGAFDKLFPMFETGTDPIGVVSRLNASLADNYNDAAIEKMAKQCRNTAVSCIRSLCGTDFTNCYRNRTDVMADGYDTGVSSFDNSMNKLGGVLDFNIIRGLCVSTIKDADVCDEHLKIQSIKNYDSKNAASGWGDKTSVRDSWVDAIKGYQKVGEATTQVLMGCRAKKGTSDTCDAKADNVNLVEDCGTVDEDGCIYDVEYYISETDYAFSMSVDSLFQEVLGDIELEAQAKYNAKLTSEQNMCVSANSGGIMGNREMSSTYQWVKLRSKRIPKNYSTAGLKINDFVASNDLYGSFCRARVTIQSDDPDIQSALQSKNQNWSTAYFAVGDVFTCGSWIPQDKLQEIATMAACKAAKANGTIDRNVDCKSGDTYDKVGMTTGQKWATAAATIGSAGLGVVGMELLQTQTGLGGLLNTTTNKSSDKRALETSYANAKALYDEYCGSNGIAKGEDKCFTMSTGRNVGIFGMRTYQIKIDTSKTPAECDTSKATHSCDDLEAYIDDIKTNALQIDDKGNSTVTGVWQKGLGRGVVDTVGAAALGITGGLATSQNIKASNRQKFTADEQEFMNRVGDHIYCFIGADEAGTYGDLIEISLD